MTADRARRAVGAGGEPITSPSKGCFVTTRWTVVSSGAGSPILGCATGDGVRLPLAPSQAVPWKEGSLLIEDIPPGTYTVTAKCLREDVVAVQKSAVLSLKDGETTELNFTFSSDRP